jgi:penicillin-binding protein 2
VARSSNVFFGILAQRLMDRMEFERLLWWYDRFGLGQTHGIALSEESPGALGPGNRDIQRSEIEFMAIGQGPVSCTPLQIVTAYARLVGGDMRREPRLVVAPEPPRGDEVFEPTPPGPSPTAVAMALEGMRQGASTRDGTTHHITHDPSGMHYEPIFNVEGVTVMAKSGTADPGSRWIDLDLDGEVDRPDEIDSAPRDHAWAVVLVQPDGAPRPTHAVAVVVEYAGSGGRVAGPVANQIVHALKLHQYLQWPPVR